jgi:hypothetical protein
MAIAQNDLFRSTITWRMANQLCANVWHWRAITSAGTSTEINQFLNGILSKMALFAGAIATNVHESIVFEQSSVVTVHGANMAYGRSLDLNINGVRQGDLLPGFVAAPLFWNTSFAGRSRRGRSHIGGWLETDQDAGILESSALTRLEDIRDAVLGQRNIGASQLVIYSRKIAEDIGLPSVGQPVPPTAGAIGSPWAPVEDATTSLVLGSMYSRRIGIGS